MPHILKKTKDRVLFLVVWLWSSREPLVIPFLRVHYWLPLLRKTEPSIGTSLLRLSLPHEHARPFAPNENERRCFHAAQGAQQQPARNPSLFPFEIDRSGREESDLSFLFFPPKTHIDRLQPPAARTRPPASAFQPPPSISFHALARSRQSINPPPSESTTGRASITSRPILFHLCAVPSRPAPSPPLGTRAPCRRTSP